MPCCVDSYRDLKHRNCTIQLFGFFKGISHESFFQEREKRKNKDTCCTEVLKVSKNTRFEQMFWILQNMKERKHSYRNSQCQSYNPKSIIGKFPVNFFRTSFVEQRQWTQNSLLIHRVHKKNETMSFFFLSWVTQYT